MSTVPSERKAVLMERLLSRVAAGPNGCVISLRTPGSRDGYAHIGLMVGGVVATYLAHRVVWEASHGPIPEGETVDHTCFVRRCINPEHLRLLPNFENARRTRGRD